MANIIVSRKWWAFVLRGALSVLFGLTAWLKPGIALFSLVMVFGVFTLAEGLLNVTSALRREGEDDQPWWMLALEGLASIIVGMASITLPELTSLALIYLIALRAIATGSFQVAAAIRLRELVSGEWTLAMSGVISLAFGVLVFVFPGAGALSMLLWIGAYAIGIGALLIGLGVALRSLDRSQRGRMGGRLVESH